MNSIERRKTAETLISILNRLSGKIRIYHDRIEELQAIDIFASAPILFSRRYNETMNLHFKYSLGYVRNKHLRRSARRYEVYCKARAIAQETGADFQHVKSMLDWEMRDYI